MRALVICLLLALAAPAAAEARPPDRALVRDVAAVANAIAGLNAQLADAPWYTVRCRMRSAQRGRCYVRMDQLVDAGWLRNGYELRIRVRRGEIHADVENDRFWPVSKLEVYEAMAEPAARRSDL